MVEEIRTRVLNILLKYVKDDDICNLDADEDYMKKYAVSSLDFVKIILEIEEKFNIEIDDDKLSLEKLGTIGQIVALVEQYHGK